MSSSAGGVLLIGLAPGGSNATLLSYLFGSLTSVSRGDLLAMTLLTAAVLVVVAVLARLLFAVSFDEEFAAVRGVRTRLLGSLLAVRPTGPYIGLTPLGAGPWIFCSAIAPA